MLLSYSYKDPGRNNDITSVKWMCNNFFTIPFLFKRKNRIQIIIDNADTVYRPFHRPTRSYLKTIRLISNKIDVLDWLQNNLQNNYLLEYKERWITGWNTGWDRILELKFQSKTDEILFKLVFK